ncbi:MAG: hypothetical protein A2033_16395 [Bacteroidetes bacterium GWA2_31_9]|nr:MAG: hypothetical protein A2033_16395 [Bacteroidetes bacterium GWA2_31_9]
MIKYILFSLFFLFSFAILAQEGSKSAQEVVEKLIEEIASNTDEELDYTTIYEELTQFYNDPLNLNSATKEELDKLQALNDFQINSLINYRTKFGNLLSLYELQLVYGFDVDDIKKIAPFVTVEAVKTKNKLNFARVLNYGSNQLFLKSQRVIETQKGYLPETTNGYLGSPYKIYTRYKFNYKNQISAGFTAEKDPGEEFFKGTQKNGFDYYTAHLQINNIGIFKTISLGDYQVGFGQGLVINSGMSYSKSSYVMNIKKKGQGIKKYSSADENLFMRGAGTTLRFKNLDFSAFYSQKKIDANVSIQDTISEEVIEVSSFQNTGYHTTLSELADKHTIQENVMGGNLTYNREKFNIGLTYLNYFFDAELTKDLKPYQTFDFIGTNNSNLGFNYQFVLKGINFFGEIAASENNAIAYLNGAVMYIAPQVSVSVLQRNYSRDYQSYYGKAFSEGSSNSNEKGLYIGTEILPYQKFKISAYIDTYKFPWLKFNINSPSSGVDYFAQLDYSLSRNVQMYLKFKNEIKSDNSPLDSTGLKTIIDVSNTNIRYHISYQVTNTISMKDRIEFKIYNNHLNTNDKGYLIYHDINYKPMKLPLTISFRYAMFETDSYDTRLYAFESDILYAFSIPAYYSKGTRTYITIKYSISDKIDFWINWGQFYYSDKNVISSGLTEIQGNHKSEVKAQIRIKF